ncbi:hypothetical protein, partial [Klebsiella pneumoniae]|uniref:hypothetical protein n=1 Tax=Klebsiella pneumoniae TaxID=573 RepID=UPI003EE216D8
LAALLRRPRHPQFRPVVFRVDDYRLSDVPDEEKAAMRAHPFRVIEDDGAAATVVAWFNRRDRGVAEDVARFLQRRNNRVGQAALPAARP